MSYAFFSTDSIKKTPLLKKPPLATRILSKLFECFDIAMPMHYPCCVRVLLLPHSASVCKKRLLLPVVVSYTLVPGRGNCSYF